MRSDATLDAVRLLATLERHRVRYVLIGGLGAVLHGSPLCTGDADICPAADLANLERLAGALRELDARPRSPEGPQAARFRADADALAGAELWALTTGAGDLDIALQPSGTGGYEDLAPRAVVYEVGGARAPTAALEDIIRSKDAANRDKDRGALPTLRDLLARSLAAPGESSPRAGERPPER